MRFCSPLKVVKSLTLLVTIATILYFYVVAPQSPTLKPSRKKYYARYYSSNSTILFHKPLNSNKTGNEKEIVVSLDKTNEDFRKKNGQFDYNLFESNNGKVCSIVFTHF